MNRMTELMGQIAKERVRLRPVPRRGVGRLVPDPDQGADDEPAMGSPPEIAFQAFSPAEPQNAGIIRYILTKHDVIKDFPEVPDIIHTRIGASKPARLAGTYAGSPGGRGVTMT